LNFIFDEVYNFLYPGPLGKFENAGADMQGELLAQLTKVLLVDADGYDLLHATHDQGEPQFDRGSGVPAIMDHHVEKQL